MTVEISVLVRLLNDAGDERTEYGYAPADCDQDGLAIDQAVESAERAAREVTGDHSWCMTDWEAV